MPAMLKEKIAEVFDRSKEAGWVMEPDAKALFRAAGLAVPAFATADSIDEAAAAGKKIGYPVAAKVVSPRIVHKSDVGGVAVGVKDEAALREVYERFAAMEGFAGMLVEQMVSGVEVIIGAKIDYQFGPVVLLGIGGTGVEIYKDVAIRMAPLTARDVSSMIGDLTGRKIFEGYRGAPPVSLTALTATLVVFSEVVMDAADRIESIDLNPVMCTVDACIIADARIMLSRA
jgi:succinyl-CoA synthetase beta subunit